MGSRARGQPILQYNMKSDADRLQPRFLVDPEVLEKMDAADRGKYVQQARPQNPIFEELNFQIPQQTPAQQPVQQQPMPMPPPQVQAPAPAPMEPQPQPNMMAIAQLVQARQQQADNAQRGKFSRAMGRPEAGLGAIAQGVDSRPTGRKFGRSEKPSARNMPSAKESNPLFGEK